MTDRLITYAGAIPLETDLAYAQLGAMSGIGFGLEAVFGSGPIASGLACTPTVPASLSVTIGRGSITQLTVVDGSSFGSVPASSDPLLKIGVNRTPTTLTFVAPTSPGQSQAFLIQAQFSETDAVPVALTYYNSANPSVSFSGPNNSGTTQYTQRIQRALIQVKNGVPASTGSQSAPSADAGWSPLYVVTLANGQTSITAGQISQHSAAPFLPFTLPQLAPGFSRIQPFVASGTFTVPLGVTRLRARVWGGGGGSGGTYQAGSGSLGGGGGGYSEGVYAVTPGTTISITVGAGGSAGVGGPGPTAGGSGGTSSVGGACSATGGAGGAPATGSAAPSAAVGGQGFGGYFNVAGCTCDGPFNLSSGVCTSRGGASYGGLAAHSGSSNISAAGIAGFFPGGGAAGGCNESNGAVGGGGLVILEY